MKCVAEWLVLLVPPLMYVGRAPADIAISLVALLFLVNACIGRNWGWIHSRWLQAGLLLWTFLIVHSLFQSDVLHSLSRAAPWGRYLLFAAALAFWIATDAKFSKKLFISIAAVCGVMVFDAWLQYATGHSLTGNEKWRGTRLTGPYDMPRLGYTLTWLAVPVLGVLVHGRKGSWVRTGIKLFLAALLVGAIVLTGDRAPTVLTLFSVGLIFLFSPWLRKKLLYCIPLACLLVGGLFVLQPSLYERHVGDTQKHLGHFWQYPYGRIVLDSWDIIQAHPVFGIGVKEYRNESKGKREHQPHPHNNYLELQTETGVFGLLLLLALYGVWMRDMWRSYPVWSKDVLAIALVAAVLMRIWPLAPSPSFYTSWNAIPLWLMLGWWCGRKNMLENNPAASAKQ